MINIRSQIKGLNLQTNSLDHQAYISCISNI